jgi:hypothetical protein
MRLEGGGCSLKATKVLAHPTYGGQVGCQLEESWTDWGAPPCIPLQDLYLGVPSLHCKALDT